MLHSPELVWCVKKARTAREAALALLIWVLGWAGTGFLSDQGELAILKDDYPQTPQRISCL